jgi:type 1 glutamine amidotransferase
MVKKLGFALLVWCVLVSSCQLALGKEASSKEEGWVSLFDGKTLKGWKASEENKDTFSVRDGMIVIDGPRSHLFYVGPVENADFMNFELKADVMTKPGSNSGIYFHTEYQKSGWPDKGYEVQVNNSHSDWRRTGSLYGIKDVRGSSAKDNEWFTEHIIVQDKQIIIKVNGQITVDYTEPENIHYPRFPGRKIARGTFALQGHDPKSVIYYKNIMVKPLPRLKVAVLTGGHGFEHDSFFTLFKGYDDIEYVEVQLKDHSEIFEDISKWDYDVIVLYNMTQEMSPQRQKNFIKLLNQGVGLVALHHTMGAFQAWPEYRKIIGAKYYLKPIEENGVERRASTYKHDVDINVHIVDTSHPITRGMSDFQIHDETYNYCGFEKDNHVLLTTDHPENNKSIAWVRRYGKARVCGIQLGHDSAAYANPNFRQLIIRSIRWTAGRLD